ncbi:uncharacterized protein [Primulina eburnea]|uniref:uncharacterized protein n=1 Tax=Primulina eburnea TaxID=1245227 RepID=UPI003C6C54E5
MMNGSNVVFETEEDVAEARDVLVDSMLTYDPPSQEMVSPELPLEFLLPAREKPLVSSRFGNRKPMRTTPEGMRALKLAKPKRQETLESTWKMITEGRHVPLSHAAHQEIRRLGAPRGIHFRPFGSSGHTRELPGKNQLPPTTGCDGDGSPTAVAVRRGRRRRSSGGGDGPALKEG